MKTALLAIYWEILYRNRLVFLTLALLLAIMAGLTWSVSPGGWAEDMRSGIERLAVLTFLASLLIGFAPFTLMESGGGWRMSSMITRWFALPLRTSFMAILPALVGCAFIAGLALAWVMVIDRVAPGLDEAYLVLVLMTGMLAVNAVAWTVPRRPVQFWTLMAVLFPVIMIFAFGPQDQPNTVEFRRAAVLPLTLLCLAILGYTWFIAAWSRCGAWPGEIKLRAWIGLVDSGSVGQGRFGSPAAALFRCDALPILKFLCWSWLVLVACLYVVISLQIRQMRPDLFFSWRVLPLVGLGVLPILAVLWLAVWGTFAGGEPGALFRPRLSSFRATLPVSCGMYAGQRLGMLLAGWAFIWLPLVFISLWYTPEVLGIPADSRDVIQLTVARAMAISAFILVGALPVFLTGRFEGFPNVLLSSVCVWGGLWGLLSVFSYEDEPGWRWGLLSGLLGLKVLVAAAALAMAWRRGHITWRFPAALCVVCGAVLCFVLFVLPLWRAGTRFEALTAILLVPLARPALCPLALAANRHR